VEVVDDVAAVLPAVLEVVVLSGMVDVLPVEEAEALLEVPLIPLHS